MATMNQTNAPPSPSPPGLNPCWRRSKPTAPWWRRPSSTRSTSMTSPSWSTCRRHTPSIGLYGACTRASRPSITSTRTPRYPESRSRPCFFYILLFRRRCRGNGDLPSLQESLGHGNPGRRQAVSRWDRTPRRGDESVRRWKRRAGNPSK